MHINMNFRSRLKDAGIGLFICSISLPVAFVITMITFPFWRWFEIVTGVESFGHSGPSEWCYWLVYGILVLLSVFVWWFLHRAKQQSITKHHYRD